jgi:carbon monoxide dehydrogenase subunit G
MKQVLLCTALAGIGAGSMLADFSYQQTTQITGGAMQGMMRMAGAFSKQAREPMVSTIIVKGHRMVHSTARSAQIIDVDKETITDINFDRKTYSVMTFAQMKQMMEDMMNRMQQKTKDNPNNMKFKASVKDTGQTKTIDGMPAKERIVTLTVEGADETGSSGSMDMTSDTWIAPVAGYEEVRAFYKLYAAKMGIMPGQNMGMFMGRPEMAKGMSEMVKEMAKIDGVPVETVMKMGGNGTAPPSNAPANQDQAASQPSSDSGSALGRLAGIGGFGHRKKSTDQQQSAGDSSGTMMEMTTKASGFSTAAVDASKFDVPEGFKQVDPEMGRHGR